MISNFKKIKRNSGVAMLVSVIFFLFISLAIILGLISPVVREFSNTGVNLNSKKSYFLAESGSEDAYYRVKKAIIINFPTTLNLNGGVVTTKTSIIGINQQEITASGNVLNHIRNVLKDITITNGFDFSFAVQIGPGGISMLNSSHVIGNVYSDGPITGGNNNPAQYNDISGGAVSSGSTGRLFKVKVDGSAYAHTITNSTIGADAYYQTLSGSTVAGIKYPGSSDQSAGVMPIPDSLLDQWENDALNGGTLPMASPCSYNITTSVTIGPKKIDCDLVVDGNNAVLKLTGAIWVNGQVTIQNGAKIVVDDSVGNKSVAIIADDPANRSNKGFIHIQNSASFYGSTGNADSYVMLISRNNSAELGGSNLAFQVQNNAIGNLLIYAPHGQIQLQNSVTLREVTGYGLSMQNDAGVQYSIGLSQPLFTSGPGGTWKIVKWRETK